MGRSLRATSKGRQAIGVLGDSALTSAELTGRWEHRLNLIERGQLDQVIDDFLSYTFTRAGEYYVEVTGWLFRNGLPPGVDYDLQVSVDRHIFVHKQRTSHSKRARSDHDRRHAHRD